jgi:DNA-binding transcriptional ArsR family regulator
MKKLLAEDRFTVTALTVAIGAGYIVLALVMRNWVLLGAGVVFIAIFAPLMIRHLRQRVPRRKPPRPARIEEFDEETLAALAFMVEEQNYENANSLSFRLSFDDGVDFDPPTASRWLKLLYSAGLVETNARPEGYSPQNFKTVPEAGSLLAAERARRAEVRRLADEASIRVPKIGVRSRRSPLAG